jgi:hypothetical protein
MPQEGGGRWFEKMREKIFMRDNPGIEYGQRMGSGSGSGQLACSVEDRQDGRTAHQRHIAVHYNISWHIKKEGL